MVTDAQWRRLQELGLAVLDIHDPERQTEALLQALLRVVPGDVAGELVVDLRTRRAHVTKVPDLLASAVDADVLERSLAANPALPHLRRHGELSACRVEDLCEPAEWRRNAMRRDLLVPTGVPHALLCARVGSDGLVRGWGVNRSHPFSDDERDALAAFEPFLHRAVRDRQREALVLDLDNAVSAGAGLVILRRKRVVYANTEARRLLENCTLGLSSVVRVASMPATGPNATIVMNAGGGALRLQFRPGEGGTQVVLLDTLSGVNESAITPRERVVLCYLAQGLTADAIARRAGTSVRTTHKHLQNVYRKLGVTDRLEAVLKARAAGLLREHNICDDIGSGRA